MPEQIHRDATMLRVKHSKFWPAIEKLDAEIEADKIVWNTARAAVAELGR